MQTNGSILSNIVQSWVPTCEHNISLIDPLTFVGNTDMNNVEFTTEQQTFRLAPVPPLAPELKPAPQTVMDKISADAVLAPQQYLTRSLAPKGE